MEDDDKTRLMHDHSVAKGMQLNGIYEIDALIATGGMGEVYRGHNIQTGDPVAIKVVLSEFARDQAILALFRKEASILNHLSHDAIVRYHVFTIDPTINRPYLAMEYVDGQSLGERMRKGPTITVREGHRLLARVASGLSVAHEAGIIHRDLSPDNVILPGGNVDKTKIIDFGIARSAHVGGGTLIGGNFAGKYNFVSPEQLGLFGGEVTERSDIYSLGLVIAGALRGAPLDMNGSPVEVIEKRRSRPELAGIDPDPELTPLLEAMLEPDPKDRPQSAAEIVDWLRANSSRSLPPATLAAPIDERTQGPFRPAPDTTTFGAAGRPGVLPPSGRGTGGSLHGRSLRPIRDLAGRPGAAETPAASGRSGRRSGAMAGAAVLVVALLATAGAYYGGVFNRTPVEEAATKAAAPAAVPAKPPAQPAAPNQPQHTAANGTAAPPAKAVKPQAAPAPAALPPAKPSIAPPAPAGGAEAAKAPAAIDTAKPAKSEATPAPPQPSVGSAAWLTAFDGGPCFVALREGADQGAAIDGYATSGAPFDKLRQALRTSAGTGSAVQAHVIAHDQCAVADFLKATAAAAAKAPALELSTDRLKAGNSLRGKLTPAAAGGNLSLLLIGKDGIVYNLADLLKKEADGSATFSIKLIPLDDQENAEPAPHLIVAVASQGDIKAADFAEPQLATEVLPKIRDEVNGQPGAGVAVSYFLFGK